MLKLINNFPTTNNAVNRTSEVGVCLFLIVIIP